MREQTGSTKVANGINVIAGLWLMLSAYLMGLGFSSNEFIVGVIIAVVALIGWFSVESSPWVSWVDGILGAWLLLSPLFIVGMAAGAVWNSIILGIIVLAMAIWGGMSSTSTIGRGHPRMG